MDNYYSSMAVARFLSSRGITMIGTIRSNRVGIPAEVKDLSGRADLTTKTFCEEKGMVVLTSYAVKTKSKGLKNVLIMSTIPPIMGITKDDLKFKPAIGKLYDFTKIVTEIIDQKNARNTTKTCSVKWTRTAFAYILDMIRNNAMVVFAMNRGQDPRDIDTFNFTVRLAERLTEAHMKKRKSEGLKTDVLEKMKKAGAGESNIEENNLELKSWTGSRRRCRMCIDSVKSEESLTPGKKATVLDTPEKDKKRRRHDESIETPPITKKAKKDIISKVKRQCQCCEEALCTSKEHQVIFCQMCCELKGRHWEVKKR